MISNSLKRIRKFCRSARPGRYSIYFIFTRWLTAAVSTANAAALNLGGPATIAGLREKPKPSLGRKMAISILLLAFSSWTTATAYVPFAIPEKDIFAASRADILVFKPFGSLPQSGKKRGFAVTQTRTLPFVLRRPEMFISIVAVAGAASTAPLKVAIPMAETKVSAAHFIPKPEI